MKRVFIFMLLCLCTSCFSQKNNTLASPILYLYVDEMPQFRGGHERLKEFINHNIQWPGQFDGQGTVLTSFIVGRNGTISNIKIEKGLCEECNNEAIRIIKLFPKWVAGKVKSQKVDVQIYLPIKFKLE